MTFKNIIYISIAIIILIFLLFRFFISSPQNNNYAPQQNEISKQISSEGAVTVEVVPKTLVAGSPIIFDIKLDTHTADLNYDLKSISIITDDRGNTYKPVSWTGDKGGHHSEGILTFPAIKKAKKVTLSIHNIDNKDRIFSWNIQ